MHPISLARLGQINHCDDVQSRKGTNLLTKDPGSANLACMPRLAPQGEWESTKGDRPARMSATDRKLLCKCETDRNPDDKGLGGWGFGGPIHRDANNCGCNAPTRKASNDPKANCWIKTPAGRIHAERALRGEICSMFQPIREHIPQVFPGLSETTESLRHLGKLCAFRASKEYTPITERSHATNNFKRENFSWNPNRKTTMKLKN